MHVNKNTDGQYRVTDEPKRSAIKRALCSFSGCRAADFPMHRIVLSSNTDATRYATSAEPVPPDNATTAGHNNAC